MPEEDGRTINGADSRNRTRDLLITNQLLYQLSYAGLREIISRPPGNAELLDDLKAWPAARRGRRMIIVWRDNIRFHRSRLGGQ